ncbi:MAG: Uma2 family endonuclease [Planctomycetota bacterium]
MATGFSNLAELQQAIGHVPLDRIRMTPPPGSAVLRDAEEMADRGELTCELVDGVLIEKAMGFIESRVAMILGSILIKYLDEHDLGLVAGSDGYTEYFAGCVRAPDVSFVSWDRLPGRRVPTDPIPELVPDLAVEVLSPSNTAAEMRRKLADYRQGGVRAVWLIDPRNETATLHLGGADSVEAEPVEIGPAGKLTAPAVLPGFELTLGQLLERSGVRPG